MRDAPWVAGAVGRLRSGDCVLNPCLGWTRQRSGARAAHLYAGLQAAAERLGGWRGVCAAWHKPAADGHARLSWAGESQRKRATLAARRCAPTKQP